MSESFLAAAASRAATLRAIDAANIEAKDSGCYELHGTPLTALPSLPPLTLKDIDVCGNLLENLPPELFTPGQRLKQLACARNQLRGLPTALGEVSCAKLFLAHNALEKLSPLPSSVAAIHASHNRLGPWLKLTSAPMLQKLAVASNGLERLSVHLLPMLSSLDASSNHLSALPDGLDPDGLLEKPTTTSALTTIRLSQDADGNGGDDTSSRTALSKKGKYIAFESLAQNLVDGVTNVKTDIYLRRR